MIVKLGHHSSFVEIINLFYQGIYVTIFIFDKFIRNYSTFHKSYQILRSYRRINMQEIFSRSNEH